MTALIRILRIASIICFACGIVALLAAYILNRNTNIGWWWMVLGILCLMASALLYFREDVVQIARAHLPKKGAKGPPAAPWVKQALAEIRPHAFTIIGALLVGIGIPGLIFDEKTWEWVHFWLIITLIGTGCILQYCGELKNTLAYLKETKVRQALWLIFSLDAMWLFYDSRIGFWRQDLAFMLASASALIASLALSGLLKPTLEFVGEQAKKAFSGGYGVPVQLVSWLIVLAVATSFLYAFGKLDAFKHIEEIGQGTELANFWITFIVYPLIVGMLGLGAILLVKKFKL